MDATTAEEKQQQTPIQVAKGSVWIDEQYEHTLYIQIASQNNRGGYVTGPMIAISRRDSTLVSVGACGSAHASTMRQIYPAAPAPAPATPISDAEEKRLGEWL